VFIENDQDIGEAEHFEHNILVKDNKPMFQKVVQDFREINAASHDDRHSMKTVN
jgi:hypothetical protein